jgi:hypothetical protein
MPNYTVVFDAKHPPESYIPPVGVTGGIVGTTDVGMLAVYQVPAEHVEAFKASIADCPTVIKCEGMQRGQSRDRDLGPSR